LNASDLISRFGQEETTYRIPTSIDPADDLIVRHVNDVREIMKVQEKARDLVKLSLKGTAPPAWRPYLPITQEVAQIVAEIVMLVEEPVFNDVQALQLCKQAGSFAAWLHSEIMRRYLLSIPTAEQIKIDDLKNDYSPTAYGAPSSPSEEMPSESILAGSKRRNGMTRGS